MKLIVALAALVAIAVAAPQGDDNTGAEMSSRKTEGGGDTTENLAQRVISNVFAKFEKEQVDEFKAAFTLIDYNHNGIIDKDDLRLMLASLANNLTDLGGW